jgi:DNA-binding CsgD family transcriptional regulator
MKTHNLHHVGYVRYYTDGSQIILTTQPEWAIDFIIEGFANNLEFMHNFRHSDKMSYFVFSLANSVEKVILNYARTHYNIGDGICLVSNFPTYQEQFYFAYRADSNISLNLLINKLDSLQNHKLYFIEKAKKLIDEAAKNKIYLPSKKIDLLTTSDSYYIDWQEFKEGPSRRYYISDKIWLTKREYMCTKLWLKGYTTAQISAMTNISIKTAQSYLENAKIKLDCQKKSDLYFKFSAIFPL